MRYTGGTKKLKVIVLRKKGESYNSISRKLFVPKSTLSGWLKDLPLSKLAKEKNIEKAKITSAKNIIKYNILRSSRYRDRVSKEIKDHASRLSKLDRNSLFWLGLGLFLAEGGRREKWSLRFVNSDPLVIKIIMKFYRENCSIRDNKIKLRIHLHKNCDPQKSLKYWSKIANIPMKQFYSPQVVVSSASKGKRPTNRLPFGTLHISVADASLVRKFKGWIVGLSKQFEMDMPS